MSSSHLTMQVTRLLISLAILLNGFAPAIYSASNSISRNGKRATVRVTDSSSQRATSKVSARPQANALAGAGLYSIAPTASLFPTPLLEGTNGKIAFTSDRDGNQQIYLMNPDGSEQTRITDNQASDSEPSWSPDGTQIAFVSTRDGGGGTGEIYSMSADGSNQTRLTNHSGFDFAPAWSPDGTRIAFVRSTLNGSELNYDIYVMDADGSNQTRLTTDAATDLDPAWSPDSEQITFRSNRTINYEIYLMDADGSDQAALTGNGRNNCGPAWSPDGTRIAFSSNIGAQSDIFLINVDGSNVMRLSDDTALDMNPAWSPDGTKVAYQSDANFFYVFDIYVINADGDERTRITTGTSADDATPDWQAQTSEPLPTPTPTPTPNPEADMVLFSSVQPGVVAPGGTINLNSTVYNYGPGQATSATMTTTLPTDVVVDTAETPVGSCTLTPISGGGTTVTCPLGDMSIYQAQTIAISATVNAADGVNLQLAMTAESAVVDPVAGNDTASAIVLVRAAQTGPEGKLAFVSYRDGDAEIYLTNADGSGVINLTNNPAYDWEPAWSPDGTQLVFNSDRSGAEELWLMNADGTNPTRLTYNGSNGTGFVWSPDGSRIAWQNWDSISDNYDICVINTDGTGFSNLNNDTDYQDRPQWSPDGTRILYQGDVIDVSSGNDFPDVFVMNADGSGKTNLTNSPEAGEFAPVWSPDGTLIAFSRSYDEPGIYVMNADGTNQVNLTETEYDGYPSWSPDGTRIAFSRFTNYLNMIYVMNADGSNQTPAFTDNFAGGAKVEWSPDGIGIAFDTYRDGNNEIYAVKANGGGLTNVTDDEEYDFAAKWQPTVITPP
jgi:Tol biopolymer transport system component